MIGYNSLLFADQKSLIAWGYRMKHKSLNFSLLLVLFVLLSACASDLPQMNHDQEIERALDKAEQAKKEAADYLHQARVERMESERLLAEAKGLMQRKTVACEEARKAAAKKRVVKCASNQGPVTGDGLAMGDQKSSSSDPSDPPYSPSDAPLSKQK